MDRVHGLSRLAQQAVEHLGQHTRAVLRHKVGKTVAFGRQVMQHADGERYRDPLRDPGPSHGAQTGRDGRRAPAQPGDR